jgi:hypothetical protein
VRKVLGELTNCLALIRVLKEIWELTVFALFRVSKGDDEIIQHQKILLLALHRNSHFSF